MSLKDIKLTPSISVKMATTYHVSPSLLFLKLETLLVPPEEYTLNNITFNHHAAVPEYRAGLVGRIACAARVGVRRVLSGQPLQPTVSDQSLHGGLTASHAAPFPLPCKPLLHPGRNEQAARLVLQLRDPLGSVPGQVEDGILV